MRLRTCDISNLLTPETIAIHSLTDHARITQADDLVVADLQLSQDRICVLPQRRRRGSPRSWRLRELDGHADDFEHPRGDVFNRLNHLACQDLRIGERLRYITHSAARNAGPGQDLDPVCPWPHAEDGRELLAQLEVM